MTAPELERTGYRAALAVRCADAVSGATVADGLAVTAWPADDPAIRLRAARSPVSELFGFGMLPGLRDHQQARSPGGVPLPWPPGPAPRPYVLSVADARARYLPVNLIVQVPVPAPVEVRLDSSVSRSPASGWAVVRGELHHHLTGAPIAWAVVEVAAGPDAYDVVADGAGRFLLIAPYPEALPPLAGSPPSGPGLSAMTWPLTLSARSEPAHLAAAPGSTGPPELATILGQAGALMDVGGVAQPTAQAELAFGAPTVLTLLVQPS